MLPTFAVSEFTEAMTRELLSSSTSVVPSSRVLVAVSTVIPALRVPSSELMSALTSSGASFTPVTWTVAVAVSNPPLPSLI